MWRGNACFLEVTVAGISVQVGELASPKYHHSPGRGFHESPSVWTFLDPNIWTLV